MGWNDVGGMVAILFQKTATFQKKIALGTLFLSLLFSVNVFADTPQKGEEEIPDYKLRVEYPSKVYRIYKFSEVTNVTRIHSDSSKREYKREIDYYFTISVPDAPVDDFSTVSIVIDSIFYKFSEGDAVFEFSNVADDLAPISFKDQEQASVPIGREFSFTYSPYGEVARYESMDFEQLRILLDTYGKDQIDRLKMFFWKEASSQERLEHIANVHKITYDPKRVPVDSVWMTPFNLQVNNINFSGKVPVKIDERDKAEYRMLVELKDLKPELEEQYFYNINDPATVLEGKADGFYQFKLDPKLTVTEIESEISAFYKAKLNFEVFTELVNTKMNWQLIGRYKL